ncbi:MAG: DUF4390 domain-containing protein [Pseudomonadota bacterium]|nr:DUF4390 domain-containing protein [Pseudomonadota bacterium]
MKNAALEALARFWLACSLCLLLAGPSAAAPTAITQLRTERAGDGIYLSATVQFELAAVVEDALLKGIPVFFVLEADIYRDRWYWSNPRVTSAARTLRLAYQPLTRRWRVNIVAGLITSSAGLRATLSQHYETLPEALSAVQRVARWKIAEASEVEPDASYLLDLKFRLDLSQLPRPFQIGVAGQRDWTIAAQVKDPLRLEPATPPTLPTPSTPAVPAVPAVPTTPALPVIAPMPPASTEGSK